MLDFSHIPSQQQNTTIFYAQSGSWQTWNKPRNAKMIEIFCLGGGAGGGQGTVITGTSNAGGGGASGGIVRGLIPAFLLPDTIYISVGKGGAGSSTSATAGSVGNISYVALQPTASEQTLICKSSTTTPGAGGAASGGGNAPTISVISLSAFGNLGLFTAIAGVAGANGGSGATSNGVNQAALGTNIVTGGCGGGGKGSTAGFFGQGGSITSASVILTTPVSGGLVDGAEGNSGYGTLQPFCGTGGAGGAGRSGTTGQGGRGGDGWYGCGGGGTGGGSVATKAGNGGDGLVIITVIT
jgi:hypothetical protein